MQAVGSLTGGIAHDFNNLLTIIYGNTKTLLSSMEKEDCSEGIKENVIVIQKAAQRGAELVKKLMIFSHQRELEPVTVDTNILITELLDLLKRSLGELIEIQTNLSDTAFHIHVDPGQLEHAIINLGVNARDAMPDGGTLTITTENITFDKEQASALSLQDGEHVKLTVSDTGSGIDDKIIDRIFDPFFTQKDVGKGTGLGLSMVHSFVKDSQGAITVESKVNEGTTFNLYFPKSDQKATLIANAPPEPPRLTTPSQATLLVVEDEEDIRFLTANSLRREGYNIIEAENGIIALDLLKKHIDEIDLIFTDIAMPGGMNGVQMASRAQVLKPDVKLLFTSGYASQSIPDIELTKRHPTIDKPYTPEDLVAKLQKILAEQV